MIVARSLSHSPAFNCALEQRLMDATEDYALVYINSAAVVVGRNQSIEAEADTAYCAANGIAVLRRMSGGGAVYHDEGNVNYAFITRCGRKPVLDCDPTRPVVEALASMGVKAQAGPRGVITVDGLKISGTASRAAQGRQLFHGTLLHSADLEKMSLALRGDPSRRGRMIASVPSRVANLKDLVGGTAAGFAERLTDFFIRYYGCEEGSTVIFGATEDGM